MNFSELAKKFVADGRPIGRYHQTEDEIRDEKRLAALLRRVCKTTEQEVVAERDREWGTALGEIGVAAWSASQRHGKIQVEHVDD